MFFINESIFYSSGRFNDILQDIEDKSSRDGMKKVHDLASTLKSLNGKDIKTPINMIDINNGVTFTQDNKFKINKVKLIDINNRIGLDTHLRRELRKFLGDKFDEYKFNSIPSIDTEYKFLLPIEYPSSPGYLYYLISDEDESHYYIIYQNLSSNFPMRICDNIPVSKIRIGRLITLLMPQILSSDVGKFYKNTYTQSDIESFVNYFNNEINISNNLMDNFEVVSGSDIIKYYNEDMYEYIKGQLGSSCMRYDYCSKYFGLYVNNPEVCSLLILKSGSGKILGRALLWNCENGVKSMDRIYAYKDSIINLFHDWGSKNGYIYGYNYSYNSKESLIVVVKPVYYENYPYMDTLKYYSPTKGILISKKDFSIFKRFKLNIDKTLVKKFSQFLKRNIQPNIIELTTTSGSYTSQHF